MPNPIAGLRLHLDAAYQELMEEKLIQAVSCQFSSDTLDTAQVNIAFLRRRLIELYERQQRLEAELDEQKQIVLRECEDILRNQGVIELI